MTLGVYFMEEEFDLTMMRLSWNDSCHLLSCLVVIITRRLQRKAISRTCRACMHVHRLFEIR